MQELQREVTILIVTHNMGQAMRISSRSMFMYLGELVEYGDTQARNALEQLIVHYDPPFRVRLELNEVHILLKLIKQSNLVTILSEATIHDEQGIKAIPIEIPGSDMEGCVHLLKNNYHKRSALEFIRLLIDSNAIRNRIRDWFI